MHAVGVSPQLLEDMRLGRLRWDLVPMRDSSG